MAKNDTDLFQDYQIAFGDKSNSEIRLSYLLFWLLSKAPLVKILTGITKASLFLKLPIKWMIKKTIYKQFVGGETEKEYNKVIKNLSNHHIKTILDYSIEGAENEAVFDETCQALINISHQASKNASIPFTCIKLTSIVKTSLLEKVSQKKALNDTDKTQLERFKKRFDKICDAAVSTQIPLLIDAEESWIQNAIDEVVEEKMEQLNKHKILIYNTIQFYRKDRMPYLQQLIKKSNTNHFKIGLKIVRGAYLEKETLRAHKLNYPSPICESKDHTDKNFNDGMLLCLQHINTISLCVGTHNEQSCRILVEEMKKNFLALDHSNIWFSQLYGMSDHISFNLGHNGYNICKYLPFGPVHYTLPYLIRRAQENTAIAGQMGQELKLLKLELDRRKHD